MPETDKGLPYGIMPPIGPDMDSAQTLIQIGNNNADMTDLSGRLLILLVTVTGFVGLVVGWGVGLVIGDGVGWVGTSSFIAISLLIAVFITLTWFGLRDVSREENK